MVCCIVRALIVFTFYIPGRISPNSSGNLQNLNYPKLIPRLLLPDLTWPDEIQSLVHESIPPAPQPTNPRVRRVWVFWHTYIR